MKPRIVAYCLLGGLPLTFAALGAGHFAWWWLSGMVLTAAFVPVARFGPQSVLGQFGVIAPALAIITVLCTWSEAFLFFPQYRQQAWHDLISSLVMYVVVAVVLAALARALKITMPPDCTPERFSPAGAIARIAVCGLAYLFYYLVFGGITYQFFTKQYYPEGAQIASSVGLWFWIIQFGRGVLMTLAVLRAIYTLRMGRWQTALSIAFLIWVAGGLAPLLVPNPLMGTTQRMIHIVEIFTQNFSLGLTAGWLLRPRARAQVAAPGIAAA